jgi:thymidylate synthase
MRFIQGDTFAELYQKTIDEVLHNPDYETSPRGKKIKEIENAVLQLDNPESNLFMNEVRSVPLKYLAGELLWYFSGRNDLSFISRFSNFWKAIAEKDGTCNSAYGNLLFKGMEKSQYFWAYSRLVEDKDTRQAIIHFNRPYHQYQGNKDFVCTLVGIFQIRDNKLNFTIDMRSNDVFFGLTFDLPFFTLLQQQMLKHLRESAYPTLELGRYTHIAHSLHVYEKDFQILNSMLLEPFSEARTPSLEESLIDIYGNPSHVITDVIEGIEENSSSILTMSFMKRWLYGHATNKA